VSAITPDLLERARGAMLGAAIGDAFGMALEGVAPRHVNAQVRDMRQGRLPPGHFTENTGVVLTLGESLLEHRPPGPDELAAWRRPARQASRPVPLLGRLLGGKSYGDGATQAPEPEVADAAPLVRCIPIALANVRDRTARSLIGLTHSHADCLAGGAFMAAFLWHLLQGMAPRQAMQDALRACGDLPEPLEDTIRLASTRQRDDVANGELAPAVIESVTRGLLRTASYAEAVARVANLGGRAATSGALVGALAGASYRHCGIPAHWRAQVHGLWPARGGRLWREGDLVGLAERLVQSWQAEAQEGGHPPVYEGM
jgi:ADP-ribosyl-[dinitrogen reductase] hydrolase